jgi:hypothetical protein
MTIFLCNCQSYLCVDGFLLQNGGLHPRSKPLQFSRSVFPN